MPYVMTLKEGDDFYVENARFILTKVDGPEAFTIVRDQSGLSISMYDGQTYEIAPGVTASIGTRGTTVVAKIAIDAPRSILIDPGTSYREAGGHTRR